MALHPIRCKRETLRDLLIAGIRAGSQPPGSRLPSEWSLARTHGLSRDTVRTVLGSLVEAGLVERRRGSGTWVAAGAAQRLPAAVAPSLRVSLLLPPDRLGNPIFQGILASFLTHLDARAAVAIVTRARPDPATTPAADLIIVDGNYPKAVLDGLAAAHPRLVLINGQHPDLPFACTDNRLGGTLLVRHALELGHRRIGIAHFGEAGTEMEFIHRLRGMRHALRAVGIEPLELALDPQRLAEFDATDWLGRLRRGRTLPSVLMCITDILALGAIEVFEGHGLSIPAQVGVTGFDDLPISGLVRPGLTTVRQPVEALGLALAGAVAAVLAGQDIDLHRALPPALVARATLGRIS